MNQHEGVARASSFRNYQHNLLLGRVKLETLKHHERDSPKSLSEPTSNRLGVVDGQ
jgi:hypothetical protein